MCCYSPMMRRLLLTCLVLPACSIPVSGPAPLLPEFEVPAPIHAGWLPTRASDQPFRFLVGGHLYGDFSQTACPASTFVAAMHDLAAADLDLMVCCGDTFRYCAKSCFDQTTAAMARLPFPVWNAVGNHDVAIRADYELRFGSTFGCFVHGGCAFVLLDTELDKWEISGAQLEFLTDTLQAASARDDIRAIFCFGHKLVHCHRQRYFEVLVGSNALDGLTGPNHFAANVLPLLAAAARRKQVFWFGGDIGLPHTLPAFADFDPVNRVHFLATGIGDSARDSVLEVAVGVSDVQVTMRALSGGPSEALADYDLTTWRKRFFPVGLSAQLSAIRALLPE